MSMSDAKAAERAAERERRQARIKAAGANRLAKITGTAGTQDFHQPVGEARPTAQAQSPSRPAAPARAVTSSDSADPEVPTGDQLLSFLSQSPSAATTEQSDPLLAFLAQANEHQQQQNPPVAQAQSFADAQTRSRQRSRNDFLWDLAHFLSSILLGLYAGLVNPWNLTSVFVALQLAFVGTKAVLGHHSGLASVPMFAPFIGMLPKARQRQLSVAGGLFHAARDAYRDIAIVVFIYGLTGLGGRDYHRPI